MATDYSLQLKATLDTSEVQQKLQQLGQTGTTTTVQMDQAVKNLDKSVKSVAESAKSIADNLIKGASMMRIGQLLQKTGTTAGGVFGEGLAGAGQGAMVGSAAGPYGAAIGAAVGGVISLKNAFESLEDAAKSAASQLWKIATDEKKQF